MKLPSDVRKYLAENRVEAVRFNDGIFYSINDDIPELDKPKEPLIKDEKIRKAMKVWARVNEVKEVMFDKYWHSFRDVDMVISFIFSFNDFDCLEDGKRYAIAELCGEEEE